MSIATSRGTGVPPSRSNIGASYYRPHYTSTQSNNWRGSQAPAPPYRNGASTASQVSNLLIPGQTTTTAPPLWNGFRNDCGGSELRITDFQLGTIFRAATVDEMLDRNIHFGDATRIESQFGPLSVKLRPWIVIGLTESSIIAAAMYTHQGRGGDHQKQDEIVGIRRCQDMEYQKPWGNPYEPLVVREIASWFKDCCVVHLQQLRTFD